MLIAPPYCGTPNEFHQLPVTAVVVVVFVVGAGAVVVDVAVDVGVEMGVDDGVEVVVDVEVDVEQEAKNSDVTIIQVSTIQTNPFFIYASFLFMEITGINFNLVIRIYKFLLYIIA